MGIHDREYWQDDTPAGLRITGGPRMIVTNLIIVTVAIALLDVFTTGSQWLSDCLRSRPTLPPSVGSSGISCRTDSPMPHRPGRAASGTWG